MMPSAQNSRVKGWLEGEGFTDVKFRPHGTIENCTFFEFMDDYGNEQDVTLRYRGSTNEIVIWNDDLDWRLEEDGLIFPQQFYYDLFHSTACRLGNGE